jgi:hypothetical protein
MNIKTAVHPIYVNDNLVDNPELYSSGFDKFLNADAKGTDADSLLQTGSQILNAFGIQQNRPLTDVENSCGRKPSFLRSHYEKNQWQKCANKYASSQSKAQSVISQDSSVAQNTTEHKESGMSKNTKIMIGVGVVAVIGVAVWYFKFKNKK